MIKFILVLLLLHTNIQSYIQSYECPFSGLLVDNAAINQAFPETVVSQPIASIQLPVPKQLQSVKTNVYIAKKIYFGFLKPLDPHILQTIQRELKLTNKDMQQLDFFVDTQATTFNAEADIAGYNFIQINQPYYNMVKNGLQNLPCYAPIPYKGAISCEISPSLAIKMFLATCSHEIGHIRRRRAYYKNPHSNDQQKLKYEEEKQADTHILDKHCGAAYIEHTLYNLNLCYHWLSCMDEEFLQTLIPDPTIRNSNYFEQVKYVMEHTSHLLQNKVHSLTNHTPTHPTHKERSDYFKKRCEESSSHKHPPECVTVNFPRFILSSKKEITICEPYKNFQAAVEQFST